MQFNLKIEICSFLHISTAHILPFFDNFGLRSLFLNLVFHCCPLLADNITHNWLGHTVMLKNVLLFHTHRKYVKNCTFSIRRNMFWTLRFPHDRFCSRNNYGLPHFLYIFRWFILIGNVRLDWSTPYILGNSIISSSPCTYVEGKTPLKEWLYD